MSRQRLFVGTNWKMHKTIQEASQYTGKLLALLDKVEGSERLQLFIIPPFTDIEAVRRLSRNRFWVGAQNMHWAEGGAYTGEISAPMLQELAIDLVQLGHAERRQYFNETDPSLNQKVHTAIRFGIRPLLCVGEEAEDKHYGVQRETVARQLKIALNGISADSSKMLLVAYEPVWAIGDAGTLADASWIAEMTTFIRKTLTELFGSEAGCAIPVLYGGSVTPTEVPDLLSLTDIAGLFVGRAALEPESFCEVIRACLLFQEQSISSREALSQLASRSTK